jgi:hypothetical protein
MKFTVHMVRYPDILGIDGYRLASQRLLRVYKGIDRDIRGGLFILGLLIQVETDRRNAA